MTTAEIWARRWKELEEQQEKIDKAQQKLNVRWEKLKDEIRQGIRLRREIEKSK